MFHLHLILFDPAERLDRTAAKPARHSFILRQPIHPGKTRTECPQARWHMSIVAEDADSFHLQLTPTEDPAGAPGGKNP
jgi:hypothetical protein